MRVFLILLLVFLTAGAKKLEAYQQLCTEFYDLSKSEAGEREITFYESVLTESNGPFLEAMCGSGRLLVPLLRKGYLIEGLDNSKPMLESCQKKCREENLKVTLFDQSLENLNLPHKYGLIFIAVGSFQLISAYSKAFAILKKLRDHLLPDGILLLETFIPWDSIQDCIEDGLLKKQSLKPFEKRIYSPKGFEIVHKGETTTYPKEQIEISKARYEKIRQQKVVAEEEEELAVRWYYPYEMELFLQKAGFSKIQIIEASLELNPQAIIYKAYL